MSAIPASIVFAAGLFIGGKLADASAAAFVLLSGCMTLGAFLGALRAWLTDIEPDWTGCMGAGTVYGGIVGILAAMVDAHLR